MVVTVSAKEALEEQVRLLSERSKLDSTSTEELCELSQAMAEICRVLSA